MSGPPRFTTARIERKVTIVPKLGSIEHPSQIMDDVSAMEKRFPDSCFVSFRGCGCTTHADTLRERGPASEQTCCEHDEAEHVRRRWQSRCENDTRA